ncbi:MAG: BTAD domain-containing putative transcriptional regulator [Lachnospiraceae bacterium]
MEETEKTILHITMFGGFSMQYGDQEIVLGRNTTAKFVQLLQLVWLYGDRGLSKAQIVRELYDVDDLSNPNNSFNNLLFQTRRQMVAAGLPKEDYVIRRNKLYLPDPVVPLDIDTERFEKLIEQAQATEDPKEKNDFYRKALEIYRGELLPESATQAWVVTESIRLQKLFSEAVRYTGAYAKKTKDYDAMFHIYEQAARIYPDEDWQADQIDALICKEEYQQAYQLYDQTVKLYSEEMGLPPSDQMLENYRKMSQKLTNQESRIGEIQSSLQEDPDSGAYFTTLPGFIDTYRVLERNMERLGYSVFLLLCNLVDYEGKPFVNRDKLQARSETLRQCISSSLRRGDIFTRYSASQYLVLLVGSDREGCDVVANRISKKLYSLEGTKAGVRYSNVSLADLSNIK